MKISVVLLVTFTTLVATTSAPSSVARQSRPTLLRLPRAAAPGELSHYGHIKTLNRAGARYVLRFDPAFWLTGVTANRAAAEDGAVAPGDPVPNDYYIRDESHKLLTFLVPAGARVTVLDRQLRAMRVTVGQLAQIVKGRNPTGRPLYDRARGLGYWALIDSDTVRSLDQQYQP